MECFEKYNFIKAIYKSTVRILKCNPWFGHGGHDPVEKLKGTKSGF
jgi:putative component of membrane protein insertase Oxa1/YidC/SpoIIIJ protein YidD